MRLRTHKIRPKKFKPKKLSISKLLNKARLYIGAARNPKSLLSRVAADAFSGITKLSSEYISPIEIYKHMNKTYGRDWISYSSLAFSPDTFGNHVDKVLALKALLKTDLYFEDTFAFEKITIAMNDIPIAIDAYQEILPDQMAYSLINAHIFRDNMEMSDFVRTYVLAHLIDSGFPVLLWPFDIGSDGVPNDVLEITNEIRLWINDVDYKIGEDLIPYVEKYYDMLDILIDKLQIDVPNLDWYEH